MQKYRSHKVVEAAQIKGMRAVTRVGGADGPTEVWLVRIKDFEGEVGPHYMVGHKEIEVPFDTFKRGTPKEGDYVVKYTDQPDGKPYWSWSPKDVFEAGYTALANDAKTE